jgi:hypothetical protein
MQKSLLVAALAGSMGLGLALAQNASAPAQLPPGTAAKELNDQEDVRDVLGSMANAAVTKDAFDDMVERLSTADRKRIGDFAKRDFPQLNTRIEQLRTAWQTKYGQELKLTDKQRLAGFLVVLEGEVTDPALARMHWPMRVTGSRNNEPIQAADSSSSAEYLDKGRNVAIVTVPAGNADHPSLYLSMIHENVDSWRVDVPDTITGEQIFNNLMNGLNKFSEKIDAWPANVNDAARQLDYVIYSALYNVAPAREGSQANAQR